MRGVRAVLLVVIQILMAGFLGDIRLSTVWYLLHILSLVC